MPGVFRRIFVSRRNPPDISKLADFIDFFRERTDCIIQSRFPCLPSGLMMERMFRLVKINNPHAKFQKIGDFFGCLWLVYSAYFGGKPAKPPGAKEWTLRIAIIAWLLTGTLVFMNYRASLTATLSARHLHLPFNSIESLLKTDME